jgi:nucleoside-diphosphate-sugar epimerase
VDWSHEKGTRGKARALEKESKGMRILVTGGLGFVGYHLTKRLLETTDHSLVILDNCLRGRYDEEFEALSNTHRNRVYVWSHFTRWGLERFFREHEFDLVFHLAALNGTQNFYERPWEVVQNNTRITLDVLEGIMESKRPVRFLYASSGEVYGGLSDYMLTFPTPEDCHVGFKDVLNPRWSYGASKILSEVAIASAGKAFPGLSWTICRLHNVYGPRMGDGHVIPNLLHSLWSTPEGEEWTIKNAWDTRSFCYVSDTVDALMLLADCLQAVGEIVNVGNPDEISIKNLAYAIAQYKIPYASTPMKLLGAVDKGSASRRCPNISKLQKLTGFVPKVSLDEGLRLTAEWYREQWEKGKKVGEK